MKVSHIIFAIVVVVMFAGYTIVFDTFPRSTFSELEKRDLAAFPEFSWDKLFSGEYTKEISSWFSDSEPYRDTFMAWSMEFDQAKRLSIGEDDVKIQISQDNVAISNLLSLNLKPKNNNKTNLAALLPIRTPKRTTRF